MQFPQIKQRFPKSVGSSNKKLNEHIATPIHLVSISPTLPTHVPFIIYHPLYWSRSSFNPKLDPFSTHTHIHCSAGNTKRRRRSLLRRRRPRRAWVSFRHYHVYSDVDSMKSSALAPVSNKSGCVLYHSASGCRAVQAYLFLCSLITVSKRNWMKHVKCKFVAWCACVYVWHLGESFYVGVAYLVSCVWVPTLDLFIRDQQVTPENCVVRIFYWQD